MRRRQPSSIGMSSGRGRFSLRRTAMVTKTKNVGDQHRAEHEVPPGRVFWITGLSGAGKTTLGRELWNRLRATGREAIFLDGDDLRRVIAEALGHDQDNRRRSANSNGWLGRRPPVQ